MKIELDIDPVDVGIVLDALADYRNRTRIEADGEELATVPSRVVKALADGVEQTALKVLDQLTPYADAIPAVDRACDDPAPYVGRHSFPGRLTLGPVAS